MSTSESFNPYTATETQEYKEVTLGDDAEFLISQREIQCRETVYLPKICLHTGRADNLIERSRTFHSTANIPALVMLVGVVAFVVYASGMSVPFALAVTFAISRWTDLTAATAGETQRAPNDCRNVTMVREQFLCPSIPVAKARHSDSDPSHGICCDVPCDIQRPLRRTIQTQ